MALYGATVREACPVRDAVGQVELVHVTEVGHPAHDLRLSGPLLSLPCISGGLSDARAPEYAQSLPDTGGGAALPSGGTPLSGKAHLLGAYG